MSKIEMPAKVLRAAVLFVNEWEFHVTNGIRIAWDAEGNWEVDATDCFQLFAAWSERRLGKDADQIVMVPSALSRLERTDRKVIIDTEACTLKMLADDGTLCTQTFRKLTKDYPNVGKLLDRAEASVPGHPGMFDAKRIKFFCKAVKILSSSSDHHAMTMSQPERIDGEQDGRPFAIIDWPCLHRLEGFHARGILMPMQDPERRES